MGSLYNFRIWWKVLKVFVMVVRSKTLLLIFSSLFTVVAVALGDFLLVLVELHNVVFNIPDLWFLVNVLISVSWLSVRLLLNANLDLVLFS